ncbi:MAG: hypothetical protein HOE90_12160 [Bacteriovoracaceae bacterium]|mgnify:FL=1|nr:hypothetical protein [Bacteriovoracaceae bacterium]
MKKLLNIEIIFIVSIVSISVFGLALMKRGHRNGHTFTKAHGEHIRMIQKIVIKSLNTQKVSMRKVEIELPKVGSGS